MFIYTERYKTWLMSDLLLFIPGLWNLMKSWYLTGRLDNWTTGRPGARGTPDKSNDDDGDYVEDGDNDDNGGIDDDDDFSIFFSQEKIYLIALKLSFMMTVKFWVGRILPARLFKIGLMTIMLMVLVCQERGEFSGSDGITKGGKVGNRRCLFYMAQI